MTTETTNLRKEERFQVLQPIEGTFGNVELTLLNLSLGGAQLQHASPLRIGTRARLTFRRGDTSVSIHGVVVWSHFAQTPAGLLYKSGVELEGGDVHYAAGLASMLRSGVLGRDTESLERKRLREIEREKARGSSPKLQPIEIPPTS
ncbi:MAG: PilZ domain-containing protein [Acidobacteriota bacterium]